MFKLFRNVLVILNVYSWFKLNWTTKVGVAFLNYRLSVKPSVLPSIFISLFNVLLYTFIQCSRLGKYSGNLFLLGHKCKTLTKSKINFAIIFVWNFNSKMWNFKQNCSYYYFNFLIFYWFMKTLFDLLVALVRWVNK